MCALCWCLLTGVCTLTITTTIINIIITRTSVQAPRELKWQFFVISSGRTHSCRSRSGAVLQAIHLKNFFVGRENSACTQLPLPLPLTFPLHGEVPCYLAWSGSSLPFIIGTPSPTNRLFFDAYIVAVTLLPSAFRRTLKQNLVLHTEGIIEILACNQLHSLDPHHHVLSGEHDR